MSSAAEGGVPLKVMYSRVVASGGLGNRVAVAPFPQDYQPVVDTKFRCKGESSLPQMRWFPPPPQEPECHRGSLPAVLLFRLSVWPLNLPSSPFP